jgi:hypothetical protein
MYRIRILYESVDHASLDQIVQLRVLIWVWYFSANDPVNVIASAQLNSEECKIPYVYKGYDWANMEMVTEDGEARDEIKTYLNCRYYNNTIAI